MTVIILSCHAEAAMGSYQGGRAPMPLGWLRNGIGAPPAIPLGHPPAHISRPPPRYYWGAAAIFPPVCLWVSFFLFIFAGSSLLKWKPSAEADGWDLIYGKAFTWRFVFWQLESGSSKTNRQKQSSGWRSWVCIIFCTYTRGLRRCSFWRLGRCQNLSCGTTNR